MGKNDYDIRIQAPKNKVEDQDSSIVHFKIIFLHQKKNIANGAYFFLLLVIGCKIVYSRYLEKFIVHNDFLSSSFISIPYFNFNPLAIGKKIYGLVMRKICNFGACLFVILDRSHMI